MAGVTVPVFGNFATSFVNSVSKLPIEVTQDTLQTSVGFTTANVIAGTGITVIPTGVSATGQITEPLIWEVINDAQTPGWTIIPN
tara:strand:+ start:1504 stop:1758 length:255 start_codon:yes stop_codon:yes gene_type:complete